MKKVLARYQLSAFELVQNDFPGAMEPLIEIVRSDHYYIDDAQHLSVEYLLTDDAL